MKIDMYENNHKLFSEASLDNLNWCGEKQLNCVNWNWKFHSGSVVKNSSGLQISAIRLESQAVV